MVSKLIGWALNSPLIVIILALVLVTAGLFSFHHINVEAYPDPRRPSSRWSPNGRGLPRRKWNDW